ncbi:LemA family protein [Paraburkholderia sp. BCC1885]|uniref:LemA family protein n=1 Tax=Paraburkholderia sp. BCC1885 TaxID=2562669 RepID=UPI001181FA7C|nr:LemA family protein [Paraburkholderia sp. BCC1885]
MKLVMTAITVFMIWLVSGCSIPVAQDRDADVNAALLDVLDVLDQYQYRAGLVSNLLAAVHGGATREQPSLAALASARFQLAAIPSTPGVLDDPVAFQRFEVAQRQLADSLSGLLIAIDDDRQLAADAKIGRLRFQFATTESRIAVSRDQYDQAAKRYNAALARFPDSLTAQVFGYRRRPTFSGPEEAVPRHAPRVDFGSLRGSLRV